MRLTEVRGLVAVKGDRMLDRVIQKDRGHRLKDLPPMSFDCSHGVSAKHRSSANDINGLPNGQWRWRVFDLLHYSSLLRLIVEPVCLSSLLGKELPEVSFFQ